MKKASTKLAPLVLGAASLNAALTLPASAQAKPSTSQTCGNASTAKDKQLKPDERCLMTSEQYLDQQAKKPQPSAVKELGPAERWSPLGLPGPHVNYSDIKSGKVGVVQGNGGSGGSRGWNLSTIANCLSAVDGRSARSSRAETASAHNEKPGLAPGFLLRNQAKHAA